MEAEARYTVVGATVLALLAALVAGVVWLKDIGGRGDFNRYTVYFERQALDGLDVGGEVNLRGIKVGRVEDYALSGARPNRVRVEVRVDKRVPILASTRAVVTRNFVTGIAAIALVNPDPQGKPLGEPPEGERYPVIAEGQSDLDAIAGRVNQVGEQATEALVKLNQLLTADNQRTVMQTVVNLRDLAGGMNQRLVLLDKTLQRAGAAATQVGAAATQVGAAGQRVAAMSEQAGQRLDTTLAQTEQTLRDASAALARASVSIENMERHAGTMAQRLDSTAVQIDDQIGAAVNELRLSMETATRVLERLRDPHTALLGPGPAQLGPGEKLK